MCVCDRCVQATGKPGRKEGDRYVKLAGEGVTRYEDLVQFCNNFVITSQYTWYEAFALIIITPPLPLRRRLIVRWCVLVLCVG